MRTPNPHDAPENDAPDGTTACANCGEITNDENVTELQLELEACSDECAYTMLRTLRTQLAAVKRKNADAVTAMLKIRGFANIAPGADRGELYSALGGIKAHVWLGGVRDAMHACADRESHYNELDKCQQFTTNPADVSGAFTCDLCQERAFDHKAAA